MQASRVGTVSVPAIATNNPSGFVSASKRPMRVACKNIGGITLRLSFESASLGSAGADTVDHYQLVVGANETFIVAPGQTLYVAGLGGGGILTYTSSEAYPFATEG
jgi:hypothetical protein